MYARGCNQRKGSGHKSSPFLSHPWWNYTRRAQGTSHITSWAPSPSMKWLRYKPRPLLSPPSTLKVTLEGLRVQTKSPLEALPPMKWHWRSSGTNQVPSWGSPSHTHEVALEGSGTNQDSPVELPTHELTFNTVHMENLQILLPLLMVWHFLCVYKPKLRLHSTVWIIAIAKRTKSAMSVQAKHHWNLDQVLFEYVLWTYKGIRTPKPVFWCLPFLWWSWR